MGRFTIRIIWFFTMMISVFLCFTGIGAIIGIPLGVIALIGLIRSYKD